jgi:putative peptidoglycan lipid II flippase
MSDHPPVLSSAKLIAVCTLVSRVTGLIRDMLLVHAFGLTWALDAFNYAFQFPNLFRRLFGEGALAAVFVPTFTRTLETEGRPSAWKLLARTLALLTLVILVVIVAIEGIVLAIWLIAPTGPARQLILALTGLMLPFMLTICVVALFSSILNCVGSFVPAALTPVVLNLVMIGGIVWLGPAIGGSDPQKQIFGVAISVLVAGVLQLALLVPVLRGHGVALGWSPRWRDPHVREMSHKMLPVLFGQGVLLLGTFLDAQICALLTHVKDGPLTANWFGASFAYPLSEGALSAITVAQRLYQFPLGVLGISLAVAALPTFSRLATRQDWVGWTAEVAHSLRLALFVGLLTGGLMVVLAGPIVQLLFEYRNFDAADTARAARVLKFYGLGMWAFCVQHIVLRAFYSVGDVRTPVKISCVLVPVNLAMSLVLIWFEGIREAAFAISTSTTSTLAVIVGLVLLRRESGTGPVDRVAVWAAVRMLGAALVSAVVVMWLRRLWITGLSEAIELTVLRRAIDTLGALLLGSGVYLALSALMRLPETRLLLRHRRQS